jgi:hypothetical protein
MEWFISPIIDIEENRFLTFIFLSHLKNPFFKKMHQPDSHLKLFFRKKKKLYYDPFKLDYDLF